VSAVAGQQESEKIVLEIILGLLTPELLRCPPYIHAGIGVIL
jgi:hypothetical protein